MTSDLQLAAEFAAKAVSEQRGEVAEQRGGVAEQRGESVGGDSPRASWRFLNFFNKDADSQTVLDLLLLLFYLV